MNNITQAELDAIFGTPATPKVIAPEEPATVTEITEENCQEARPQEPDTDTSATPEEDHAGDEAIVRVEEADVDDAGAPLGDAEEATEAQRGEALVLDGLLDDELPTVPTSFPGWKRLFGKRPYVRLVKAPRKEVPVLLLGYAYQHAQDGTKLLDNAKVDGTLVRNLVSECAPFGKSNEDDTAGVRVFVVRAKPGMCVRLWRCRKRPGGAWQELESYGFEVTEKGLRQKK